MSDIIFLDQTKYSRAVKAVGSTEDTDAIIKEYERLAGAYLEDDVIKNIIGNPKMKAEEQAKVVSFTKKEQVAKPEKKMGNSRTNPKPTLKRKKK